MRTLPWPSLRYKSSIRRLGSGSASAPPLGLQHWACGRLLNPSYIIFPFDYVIPVFASGHEIWNFWIICTKYSANLCFLMFVPNRTNKIGQLFYSHVLFHHCHFFSFNISSPFTVPWCLKYLLSNLSQVSSRQHFQVWEKGTGLQNLLVSLFIQL